MMICVTKLTQAQPFPGEGISICAPAGARLWWLAHTAVLLALVLLHGQSSAQIRKYVDANGVTHFTNEPPGAEPPPPARPLPANIDKAAAPQPQPQPQIQPQPLPANPAKALGNWPPRALSPP